MPHVLLMHAIQRRLLERKGEFDESGFIGQACTFFPEWDLRHEICNRKGAGKFLAIGFWRGRIQPGDLVSSDLSAVSAQAGDGSGRYRME
jgi:hypothetical protein